MAIITTDNGRKILRKAKSLYFVPYVYDVSVRDYIIGTTVYDISSIIGDSISIEKSDGDTQTHKNEFNGRSIVNNIVGGGYKFTAQCLDSQCSIMKALFGASVNFTEGVSVIPDKEEMIYALVRICFKDAALPDVYLPKVTFSNKVMIQQLRTRGSMCNLDGTALSGTICIKSSSGTNDLMPLQTIDGQTKYLAESPLLYVPNNADVFVMHSYDEGSDTYTFSKIDWTAVTGSSVSYITVSGASQSQFSV